MPRRLRILPALATAGLLAAGCEFLDNLTGDKPVALAPIHLVVRDDWTGDSLPRATCRADRGGLTASAGLDGRIVFDASPTGTYAFTCGVGGYFDRKAKVEVVAGAGGSAEIRLARRPGLEWYPGQWERQVSLAFKSGDLIAPGSFWVEASPRDSKHTFEYIYSTSLPRERYPAVQRPEFEIKTGALPDPFGADSVTVTVIARLGDTAYEVGSDTLVVPLVRNLPPTFTLVHDGKLPIRLCPQSNLIFGLSSEDPDGTCDVRFHNRNAYSPHGLIDTIVPCAIASYWFPLASQPPVGGAAFERKDSLRITVTDNRGAKAETTLTFITRPNHLPQIAEFSAMGAPSSSIQDSAIRFKARIIDLDDAVTDTWVDWGDGKEELVFEFKPDNENEEAFESSHVYSAPGTYRVILRTEDLCRSRVADTINVVVLPQP